MKPRYEQSIPVLQCLVKDFKGFTDLALYPAITDHAGYYIVADDRRHIHEIQGGDDRFALVSIPTVIWPIGDERSVALGQKVIANNEQDRRITGRLLGLHKNPDTGRKQYLVEPHNDIPEYKKFVKPYDRDNLDKLTDGELIKEAKRRGLIGSSDPMASISHIDVTLGDK